MSNHRSRFDVYAYAIFATILALHMPSNAQAQVLPPDASVAGMSLAEWGVLKIKWAFENPAGMNPIEDTTGEFSFLGDQGPVFFLDGTFGGPTVTRSVTIRDDQHIFLGLANTTFAIPFDGETEAELRAGASADADVIDQLFLEIDGVVPAGVDLFDHRQPSPPGLFDLVFPENNVFGAPAGTYPAVKDGYDVMLEPLSQGDHTLAFGGRFFDPDPENIFTASVIYNVTVVPEPSSLALGLSGLIVLLVRGRNRTDSRTGAHSRRAN